MDVTPVLPQSDGKIDFDMLDCSVFGPEVTIVEDYELQIQPSSNAVPIVELMGKESKITFYTDCARPYLAFYIKNIQRFLKISLVCEDDTGKEARFEYSNKFSFVSVDNNGFCNIPLEIDMGWQYICIDLEDLFANACGSTYALCREITVHGSCRLHKIYFQSKRHADCELPSYLRVVNCE